MIFPVKEMKNKAHFARADEIVICCYSIATQLLLQTPTTITVGQVSNKLSPYFVWPTYLRPHLPGFLLCADEETWQHHCPCLITQTRSRFMQMGQLDVMLWAPLISHLSHCCHAVSQTVVTHLLGFEGNLPPNLKTP